jgi:predicted DsbA family dithiol-disulfide isomerase
MTTPVTLDIWSDVVCPWCWVGERRLELAIAEEAAEAAERGEPVSPVRLRFHAFELQPELPSEGADAIAFYSRLFGGPERWEAAGREMAAVGQEVGIVFDYPSIRRAPNTRLAHRVIALADEIGRGPQALAAFHAAYFSHGRDVGDLETLLAVQAEAGVGLDRDTTRERIQAGEGADRVAGDEQFARALGIRGVPMFVAGLGGGGRPSGVSGAQPVEIMRQLLANARERERAKVDGPA